MELTDEVRNKNFEYVLDTHLWKTSDEYFALAVLKFCYGERYQYLKKGEAPDLQDIENSIAIEVTNSILPNDAQIVGEFTKLQQVKTEKEKERCREKIVTNGAQLEGDDFMIRGPRGSESEKEEFTIAFTQKLNKLPQYRLKGFERIGLLIYHNRPLFCNTPNDFSGWLEKAQENRVDKYDFVHVLYLDGLLFYSFSTKEKNSIRISREDIYALWNLGRMTAEGEVKDNDPIWL